MDHTKSIKIIREALYEYVDLSSFEQTFMKISLDSSQRVDLSYLLRYLSILSRFT